MRNTGICLINPTKVLCPIHSHTTQAIALLFFVDSVHFLTKYQHARKKLNLEPRESVISAFGGVGTALMVTTVILVAGFMILAQSSFGLNSAMASLTAIALVMALIADFTLLPALLLMFDKTNTDAINLQANYET